MRTTKKVLAMVLCVITVLGTLAPSSGFFGELVGKLGTALGTTEASAADATINITAKTSGTTLANKAGYLNMFLPWDMNGVTASNYADAPINGTVEFIEIMNATGGGISALNANAHDRDLIDINGNFRTDKLNALTGTIDAILAVGAKPLIKLGGVPFYFTKTTNNPSYTVYDMNVNPYPPDTTASYTTKYWSAGTTGTGYVGYEYYLKDVIQYLINKYGIATVRTWRWGVDTEYENDDWFRVAGQANNDTNGGSSSNWTEFFKLYDYSAQAVIDLLGDANTYIGTHAMSVSEGLWDENKFIDHIASSTGNNVTGGAVHCDYIAVSFYESAYGTTHNAKTFVETINYMKSYAATQGLTNLKWGVDEGRILADNNNVGLHRRAVGWTWQGAYDAHIYNEMIVNEIDYFSFWSLTSTGLHGGLPTVSYHVASKTAGMSGSTSYLAIVSGNSGPYDLTVSNANSNKSTVEKNAYATYNTADSTMRIMAYNYAFDKNVTASQSLTLNVTLPSKFYGKKVTIKTYKIDDNANAFDEWHSDVVDITGSGNEQTAFSDSWQSDDFTSVLNTSAANLNWGYANQAQIRALSADNYSKYKSASALGYTTSVANVSSTGLVTISESSMQANSAVYYEISENTTTVTVNADAAKADLAKTSVTSADYVVVPETIYLTPAASDVKTFQYYLNNKQDGTAVAGSTTQADSGSVYFKFPNATNVNVKLSDLDTSKSETIEVSTGTKGSGSLSASTGLNVTPSSGAIAFTFKGDALAAGISAASTKQLTWTFTVTTSSGTYTVKSYTTCYAPFLGSVAAFGANCSHKGSSGGYYSGDGISSVIYGIQGIISSYTSTFVVGSTTYKCNNSGEGSNGSVDNTGSYVPTPLTLTDVSSGAIFWNGSSTPPSTLFSTSGDGAAETHCSMTNDTKCMKTIGGAGYIYFDSSRSTKISHIPNLGMYFDYNGCARDAHLDKSEMTANIYYITTSGGAISNTQNIANAASYYSTSTPKRWLGTGYGDWTLADGKTIVCAAQHASRTKGAAGGTGSTAYAEALVSCQLYDVNKSALRAKYNAVIKKNCLNSSEKDFDASNSLLSAAAAVLGNPTANQQQVDAALAKLYRLDESATATVKTRSSTSATGSYISTQTEPVLPYQQTFSATAKTIAGYNAPTCAVTGLQSAVNIDTAALASKVNENLGYSSNLASISGSDGSLTVTSGSSATEGYNKMPDPSDADIGMLYTVDVSPNTTYTFKCMALLGNANAMVFFLNSSGGGFEWDKGKTAGTTVDATSSPQEISFTFTTLADTQKLSFRFGSIAQSATAKFGDIRLLKETTLTSGTDYTFSGNKTTVKRGVSESINIVYTYTPSTYTITYENRGNATISNKTSYTVEDNAFTISAPSGMKNEYVKSFSGWTGDNGTTPQTSFTIPTGTIGNKTYTANWVGKDYTVHYDYKNLFDFDAWATNTRTKTITGNGGSSYTYDAANGTVTVETGAFATQFDNFTGYDYADAYYVEVAGSTQYTFSIDYANAVHGQVFIFQHDVNHKATTNCNNNSNTNLKNESSTYKTFTKTITTDSNTKYIKIRVGCNGANELPNHATFKNIRLVKTADANTEVMSETAYSAETRAVVYDAEYGPLITPVRPGYRFLGWYKEKALTTPVTATTIYETGGDSVLFSKWEKAYDVNFDNVFDFDTAAEPFGTSGIAVKKDDNTNSVTLYTPTSNTAGEQSTSQSNLVSVVAGHTYRVSMTVTADTLNSGNKAVDFMAFAYRNTSKQPSAGTAGYMIRSEVTSIAPGASAVVTGDIAIPSDAYYLTVRLDMRSTGFSAMTFSNITVQDISVKAADGKEPAVPAASVQKNAATVSLPQVNAPGCVFDGWYNGYDATTGNGSGTKYNGGEAVSGAALHLYSKWTSVSSYTVSYASSISGASITNGSTSYTYKSGFTLGSASLTGYDFAGWKLTVSGTGDITGYTGNLAANATLPKGSVWGNLTATAQWTPHIYTVTYDGNGSTSGSTASSSHTYAVAKALNDNGFKKTGYTFANWTAYERVLNDTATYTVSQEYTLSGSFKEGDVYVVEFDIASNTCDNLMTFFYGADGHRQVASIKTSNGTTGTRGDGGTSLPKVSSTTHYTITYTLGSVGSDNVNKKLLFRDDSSDKTNSSFQIKNIEVYKKDRTKTYANKASVSNLTAIKNGKVKMVANWTANGYSVPLLKNYGTNTTLTLSPTTPSTDSNVTKGLTVTKLSNNQFKVNGTQQSVSTGAIFTIPFTPTVNKVYKVTVTQNSGSKSGGGCCVFDLIDSSGNNVAASACDTRTNVDFSGNTSKIFVFTDSAKAASAKNFKFWVYHSSGGAANVFSDFTFTVKIEELPGTGVAATYNSAMPDVAVPTRTGYTFNGYFDAASGGTKYYNGGTTNATGARNWDKTTANPLYAQWSVNSYKLTFDANYSGNNINLMHMNSSTQTANGVTFVYNETDNTYTMNGTVSAGGTSQLYYDLPDDVKSALVAGEYYTLTATVVSGMANNPGCFVRITNEANQSNNDNGVPVTMKNGSSGTAQVNWTGNAKTSGTSISNTFKFTEGDMPTGFKIQFWTSAGTSYTLTNYKIRIKLEKADAGSDYSPAARTVIFDTQVGTLPSGDWVTREGYTLDGWYSQASGGTQYTSTTTMPAQNTTLYAHWNPEENTPYKVNVYVMNTSGNYTGVTPTVYDYTGTTDTTATVTDAMIAGYCSDAGASAAFSKDTSEINDLSCNINSNGSGTMTVYLKRAQFTLTVTAGTGTQNATGGGTYYFGAAINPQASLIKDYNNLQWDKPTATTMPAEDTEYTATATANTATITLNKDASGKYTDRTVELYQSGKNSELTALESTGVYTFSVVPEGIYDVYVNGTDTETDVTVNSTTSYAGTATLQYYTLTLSGGTGISATSGQGVYLTGKTATISATVSEGYTFKNWTGSSTITEKSTTVTMDGTKTYTANADENVVTVTVNKDGTAWSTKNVVKLVNDSKTYTLTASADGNYSVSKVKAGKYKVQVQKYFANSVWNTTLTDAVADLTVNSASTAATVNYYTLTLNKDTGIANVKLGSAETTSAQVLAGATVSLSAEEKSGYTFQKWSDDATTQTDYSYTMPAQVSTIQAISDTNNYTITYVVDTVADNGLTPSVTKPDDDTYTVAAAKTLATPSATGYTLKWNLTLTGSDGYIANSSVNNQTTIAKGSYGNITATAVWIAKTYAITLDDNGGTGGKGTVYEKYGEGYYSDSACTQSITSVTIPTREGYTFGGYFSTTTGGTQFTKSAGEIKQSATSYTKKKTMYAVWTPVGTTLLVDTDGGKYLGNKAFVPTKDGSASFDGSTAGEFYYTVTTNDDDSLKLTGKGNASKGAGIPIYVYLQAGKKYTMTWTDENTVKSTFMLTRVTGVAVQDLNNVVFPTYKDSCYYSSDKATLSTVSWSENDATATVTGKTSRPGWYAFYLKLGATYSDDVTLIDNLKVCDSDAGTKTAIFLPTGRTRVIGTAENGAYVDCTKYALTNGTSSNGTYDQTTNLYTAGTVGGVTDTLNPVWTYKKIAVYTDSDSFPIAKDATNGNVYNSTTNTYNMGSAITKATRYYIEELDENGYISIKYPSRTGYSFWYWKVSNCSELEYSLDGGTNYTKVTGISNVCYVRCFGKTPSDKPIRFQAMKGVNSGAITICAVSYRNNNEITVNLNGGSASDLVMTYPSNTTNTETATSAAYESKTWDKISKMNVSTSYPIRIKGEPTKENYSFKNWSWSANSGNYIKTMQYKTDTQNSKFDYCSNLTLSENFKYSLNSGKSSGTVRIYEDYVAKNSTITVTGKVKMVTPNVLGLEFNTSTWSLTGANCRVIHNGTSWNTTPDNITLTSTGNENEYTFSTTYTVTAETVNFYIAVYSSGENSSFELSDVQVKVDDEYVKDYILATTSTAAATLTANWNGDEYGITYTLNGGTNASGNPAIHTYGTATSVADPTRAGYTFDGWTVTSTGATTLNNQKSLSLDATTYTSAINLAANWTPENNTAYKVEHYLEDLGADTYTLTSTDNKSGTTDTTATATAGTFPGFVYDSSVSGTVTSGTINGNGNLVLKLYYKRQSYTLTVTAGTGTQNATGGGTFEFGAAINPQASVKTGYNTLKWDKTPATTMPAEDTEYTATATANTYTISYELDGGTHGTTHPGSYTVETATFTISEPTKSGWDFLGWTGTGLSEATKSVSVTKGSTGDRTYTATWKQSKFGITLNTNGGTYASGYTAPTQYTAGTGATLPTSANISKTGYTFGGWYATSACSGTEVKTITTTDTGAKEYWAKWTAVEYTITYNLDGGTNHKDNPAKYTVESAAITLQQPTKTGYSFTGWTGSNGTTAQTSVTIAAKSTGDKTYTAHWNINQYTISFESNGGSSVTAITQNYNTAVTAPTAPTKTGYTFGGWYSDAELKNAYTFTTMPAQNTTLYAKWDVITYKITYKLNGGSVATANPATYTVESANFTLTNPTKENYKFTGWTEGTGTTKNTTVTITTNSTTGDKTYTAHWEADVHVQLNNGTGTEATEPVTVDCDGNYSGLPAEADMSRTGYVFAGWYTQGSGYGEVGGTKVTNGTAFSTAPATTLYASWKNAYVLDFSRNTQLDVTDKGTKDKGEGNRVLTQVSLTGADGTFKTSADNDIYTVSVVDGKIKFALKPQKMLSSSVTVYYQVQVSAGTSSVKKAADTGETYTGTVVVVPANSLYYEEDFFTFSNGTITEAAYQWQNTNAAQAMLIENSRAGSDNYGYENNYDTETTGCSGGNAKVCTVDLNHNNNAYAQFTFTGTGFDLYSVTHGDTGMMKVDIYSGNEVNAGNKIGKSIAVDTYRGYAYGRLYMDGQAVTHKETSTPFYYYADDAVGFYTIVDGMKKIGTDATKSTGDAYGWLPVAADSDANALYQEPVLCQTQFIYGTYTVTVTPIYSTKIDHNNGKSSSNGSYRIYVDSVKIYNPLNPADVGADATAAYGQDEELNAKFVNLHDKLVRTKSFWDGETATTGNYGVAFLDGNTVSSTLTGMAKLQAELTDYSKYGPNNEVMLGQNQGVCFTLTTSDSKIPAKVRLGTKMADASTGSLNVYCNSNKTPQSVTVKGQTDLFRDIGNITWTDNGNGTYSTTLFVTNPGAGTVSLTKVKWSYGTSSGSPVTSSLSLSASKNAMLKYVDLLGATKTEEAYVEAKDVTVEWDNKTPVLGDTVTLNITAPNSFVKAYKDGQEIAGYTEPTESTRCWSVSFKAEELGDVMFDIYLENADGYKTASIATEKITVGIPKVDNSTASLNWQSNRISLGETAYLQIETESNIMKVTVGDTELTAYETQGEKHIFTYAVTPVSMGTFRYSFCMTERYGYTGTVGTTPALQVGAYKVDGSKITLLWKESTVEVGATATLTVTTPKDIVSVTVDGEKVTACTEQGNSKVWTYATKAAKAGSYTYNVVVSDSQGMVSESIPTGTLTVKETTVPAEPEKLSFFQRLIRAIKALFTKTTAMWKG